MSRLRVFILALLAALVLLPAGTAAAADGPMGNLSDPETTWDQIWDTVWNGPTLPGDEDCVATPPKVQHPRAPWAGAFMVDPEVMELLPNEPPADIWDRKGAAGLLNFTFDTGCGLSPQVAVDKLNASTDTGLANRITQFGLLMTAMADRLDTLSWDPTWITAFFSDLASTLVDAFNATVIVPYLAVGLGFASIMLLLAARRGAISTVAAGSAWAAFVVVLGVLVLTTPLLLPNGIQGGSAALTTQLYGGQSPADAVTDRTVESVHWQGLARRTFGEDPSPAAMEALPVIYESTGWSWGESRAIKADPAAEQPLWQAKMERLNTALSTLKERSPEDYADFTGVTAIRTDQAMLEAGYSAAANTFRIFAALLRIACIFSIFILGLMWLCALPYLVTPQGEKTGRGLLSNSLRSIGYVVVSILTSFGFGAWAYYAMDPALGTGASLILLVVGTVLFWSISRPDRKLLSLASGGRVTGFGGTQKWLLDKLATYAAVRAGTEHLDRDDDDESKGQGKSKPVSSEEYVPPVFDGEIVVNVHLASDAPGLPQHGWIDGEAYDTTYQRKITTESEVGVYDAPASDVTYGEVELYTRPVDADR